MVILWGYDRNKNNECQESGNIKSHTQNQKKIFSMGMKSVCFFCNLQQTNKTLSICCRKLYSIWSMLNIMPEWLLFVVMHE